jgi:hypothetical protein
MVSLFAAAKSLGKERFCLAKISLGTPFLKKKSPGKRSLFLLGQKNPEKLCKPG